MIRFHYITVSSDLLDPSRPATEQLPGLVKAELHKLGYSEPIMIKDNLAHVVSENGDYLVSGAFAANPKDWVKTDYFTPPPNFILDIKIGDREVINNIQYLPVPLRQTEYGYFDSQGHQYGDVTHFKVHFESIV